MIDEEKARNADYGKRWLMSIRSHLDALERLLTPQPVTRVSLETVGEGPSASAGGDGGGGGSGSLFTQLADMLALTDAQKAAVASRKCALVCSFVCVCGRWWWWWWWWWWRRWW